MQMATDTALGMMKRIILGRVSSSPLHIALCFPFCGCRKEGTTKDKRRRQRSNPVSIEFINDIAKNPSDKVEPFMTRP